MKTLDQVVAATIRRFRGGDGIEELADHLGIKPGMLYRLSNPMDEGARINSKHLIPLMEKTKDYTILKHTAARLGFLCVRLPRVRSARHEDMAEYQRRQAQAFERLAGFFAGARSAEETLEAIRREMEAAAGFAKAVEAHDTPSLFEDEQA